MIRTVIILLLGILLITFLRMVVGVVLRSVGQALKAPGPTRDASGGPPFASTGGTLKRDPVCGTFVPVSTHFQKTINGASHYFCSPECRDKYAG